MKKPHFFLIIILFAGMSVAGVKYVAVVETEIDAQSGASANLNPAEVREITAEIRRQAIENLPSDRYSVMTSETVQSMGGAVLEECADENCVITLGSKIGADYIVRGTIGKFQTRFTLKVEMYETDNGTLVATSEPIRTENVGEILDMATGACGKMFGKFAGGQGQVPIQQTIQPSSAKVTTTNTNHTYGNNATNHIYTYDMATNRTSTDFTAGQRWGTWALNILPGGLGSFFVMKDNVGGCVLLGANIVALGSWRMLDYSREMFGVDDDVMVVFPVVAIIGAGIFNAIHSGTYHKPNPNPSSHAANNFKPYDGLKLAVFPTETGDFKVSARYDYSF